MDVFDAIAKRHSYRGGFTDDPVPRQDLERIVQAGIQAPSGCNAQTTSFVIVDEPELRDGIAAVVDKQVVREAQAIIVCAVDHKPVYQGKAFGVEDCAAAVENMLLAITALGYATVWLDGMLRSENRAQRIAELLGIPDEREVRIILPLGRPTTAMPQKDKHPFNQRAWFNRYGG
jgi:nitroreductase